MPNTKPIQVETETRRIPLVPKTNLDTRLKATADDMGAAGYQLCATFVVGTELVLVFQLAR